MAFSCVLALALAAAGPRLEVSLAAGAGHDSNLNHAASGAARVDSAFGFVGAGAGGSIDLGGSTSAYAGLRLDLERYPDVVDLGSTSLAVEGALVQELGWRVALILAPSASRAWTGDPERDAVGFAGRLTLRVKPVSAVALRAFLSYAERSAVEPVFSSYPWRAGAAAEWNPRGRTWVSIAYAEERGDEVFYRPTTSGGGGGGMGGRRVDTFGGAEEAYRAAALTRSVSAALEAGLGAKAHLFARYELRRVTSDEPDFTVHVTTVGVGLRP